MKCSISLITITVICFLCTYRNFSQLSISVSDRYRRSYDSEFTAPLVMYHVWPALMEGDAVVVKGEAVTRRGAPVLTV